MPATDPLPYAPARPSRWRRARRARRAVLVLLAIAVIAATPWAWGRADSWLVERDRAWWAARAEEARDSTTAAETRAAAAAIAPRLAGALHHRSPSVRRSAIAAVGAAADAFWLRRHYGQINGDEALFEDATRDAILNYLLATPTNASWPGLATAVAQCRSKDLRDAAAGRSSTSIAGRALVGIAWTWGPGAIGGGEVLVWAAPTDWMAAWYVRGWVGFLDPDGPAARDVNGFSINITAHPPGWRRPPPGREALPPRETLAVFAARVRDEWRISGRRGADPRDLGVIAYVAPRAGEAGRDVLPLLDAIAAGAVPKAERDAAAYAAAAIRSVE